MLGRKHPEVANTLNNMAIVYESQGAHEMALELYESSLEIFKAALGDNHPEIAGTLGNMAVVDEKQGKIKKALDLYTKAHKIYQSVVGNDHPSTQVIKRNLEKIRSKLA